MSPPILELLDFASIMRLARKTARNFIRINVALAAIPFALVADIALMGCVAVGIRPRAGKTIAWLVSTAFWSMIACRVFNLGWLTTFYQEHNHCSDINMFSLPCNLFDILYQCASCVHAFARLALSISKTCVHLLRACLVYPVCTTYMICLLLAGIMA